MAGGQHAEQLRDRTSSLAWRFGDIARGCRKCSMHVQWHFLSLLLTCSAKWGLPQASPSQEGKRYDRTGVFATFFTSRKAGVLKDLWGESNLHTGRSSMDGRSGAAGRRWPRSPWRLMWARQRSPHYSSTLTYRSIKSATHACALTEN